MTAEPPSGSPGAGPRPEPADAHRVGGACHALFAFDLGFRFDLEAARRRLGTREGPAAGRPLPSWFRCEPTPLTVTLPTAPIGLGAFQTEPEVRCTLYGFGTASVAWRIPIDGPLGDLPALSAAVYENQGLLDASRRELEALLARLAAPGAAAVRAELAEDYVIFAFSRWTPAVPPADLIVARQEVLTALVLAETAPLSQQQVRQCIESPLSYGREDLAIAHWNGAILFDRDPADVLLLLEYANVQLVELRSLDRLLDRLLRRARVMMTLPTRVSLWPLVPGSRDLRQLAEAQAHGAILFEGVKNAVKLVGDQYLAGVYRLAAERLQLPEWDAAVLRKIEAADSIFEKISGRQSTRRMEVLEIIIIVLILIEVIRPIAGWLAGS